MGRYPVADPHCHRTERTFARAAMALLHLWPPGCPRVSTPSRSFWFFKLHRAVQHADRAAAARNFQRLCFTCAGYAPLEAASTMELLRLRFGRSSLPRISGQREAKVTL